eukprot:10588505-Alexandrium_andersonii.AAC.1
MHCDRAIGRWQSAGLAGNGRGSSRCCLRVKRSMGKTIHQRRRLPGPTHKHARGAGFRPRMAR